MTSLTTEDFPYTISYVMELLRLDERELMSYAHSLGLSHRKDEKTGRLIFTHKDIETLKKALEMKKHGEDMTTIVQHLGSKEAAERREENTGMQPLASAAGQSLQARTAGKDNITMMVEAVSQVKEGILKDLSRLLDDKLSGLDEVVVELIRCKSENDSLRKKLNDVTRTKEHLEYELSRFKPVQFGFYRKT